MGMCVTASRTTPVSVYGGGGIGVGVGDGAGLGAGVGVGAGDGDGAGVGNGAGIDAGDGDGAAGLEPQATQRPHAINTATMCRTSLITSSAIPSRNQTE